MNVNAGKKEFSFESISWFVCVCVRAENEDEQWENTWDSQMLNMPLGEHIARVAPTHTHRFFFLLLTWLFILRNKIMTASMQRKKYDENND